MPPTQGEVYWAAQDLSISRQARFGANPDQI